MPGNNFLLRAPNCNRRNVFFLLKENKTLSSLEKTFPFENLGGKPWDTIHFEL